MRTFQSVLFAMCVAACTGSGQAQVNYSAEATVATPTLVEVQPGVQVVAESDQPVFYNEGLYWRFEGGVWYRSQYHDRAWVRVEAPPVAVRNIPRPEMYVHYHANVNANAHANEHARVEERHDENQERREQNQEHKEAVQERKEENQERKDDRAVNHDSAEVRDENREIARDKANEKRDEKERAKDEKDLKKDEKKKEKDRR